MLIKNYLEETEQVAKIEDNYKKNKIKDFFLNNMTNTKNILIIGNTGQGKSTLANVITGTNNFVESSSDTSETKNYQISQGNGYQVIDTINLDDEKALDNIWSAIESIGIKKEIHQVFFVFKGNFVKEQVISFNKFRGFIKPKDDNTIIKYITLVRTNFPNFKVSQKCEEDCQSLRNEKNKQLNEIVNFCNGIIYVDNPPMPVIKQGDDEETIEDKKEEMLEVEENQKQSQKIILDYLAKNCYENYQLEIQIPPKK